MDASIILLTKNAGDKFSLLLKCIFSQKTELTYEVLMIDSGSADNTLSIAQNFPIKIIRIKPEEFHHGKTRNLGARLAAGRILVYLTQDALPLHDNWLQSLTGDLQNPDVAMVIGRQIPWQYIKPPEKFFYAYYFPDFKIVLGWIPNQVGNEVKGNYRDNVFISNVNSAIQRDIWERFKFSEKIIMTEDKEFAGKVLAAGLQIVYQPGAPVYHAHDFSIRTIYRRSVDYGISVRQGALPKSRRASVLKLLRYLGSELKYLINNSYISWIPYSVIYEISRHLGTYWGKTRLARH